jgi:hypothetical protein
VSVNFQSDGIMFTVPRLMAFVLVAILVNMRHTDAQQEMDRAAEATKIVTEDILRLGQHII